MKYQVLIYCDKKKRKTVRHKLRKYHLHWADGEYFGKVSQWSFEELSDFCHINHLNIKIDNEFGERNTVYRRTFFQNNPPHIKGRYFCAYCGRLLKKEKVTVDHIYPVSQAKKSIRLQKKLRRKGISNINDKKNLVAACWSCNSRKRAKMGSWILRGEIGRYPVLWVFRHLLRIILVCSLGYYFYTHNFTENLCVYIQKIFAKIGEITYGYKNIYFYISRNWRTYS